MQPFLASALKLSRRRRVVGRTALGLLILAFVMACAGVGFGIGERQGLAALRSDGDHRLDLFASAVDGMLKRLEPVPATIQMNRDVVALLNGPRTGRRVAVVDTYLRRLNAHLGSAAIFVLDERGAVLATSAAERPSSPGSAQREGAPVRELDLSFRPYYLEALSGRVGRHFAVGVSSDEPGYYVSHPIRDGARVIGVAAIKLGLGGLDPTWKLLGVPGVIVDANQVVILSSQPHWRYTALADLPVARRVDAQQAQLYNNRPIGRFPLPVRLSSDEDAQLVDDVILKPEGLRLLDPRPAAPAGLLVQSRLLDGMDWRLMMFADLTPVRRQALVGAATAGLAAAFWVLLGLYLLQRRRVLQQRLRSKKLLERANAALEEKISARTADLTDANERLRREIAERERAEQTLRAAQGELVHSAKMAMLGQLATGITHELTQPLGAIRTLSGNALEFMKRGNVASLESNLKIVARLADQMGGIIDPLKGFARKTQPHSRAVDVAHVVGNALFLYDARLRQRRVEVDNRCGAGRWHAWCDANRLEQVLGNLIGNAIDAMDDMPSKVLRLTAQAEPDNRIRIDVCDTGAGLSADSREHLFEPFFTTKAAGAGLGLGLAISRDIVREFGGEIEAGDRDEGDPQRRGARFSVHLPVAVAVGEALAA